MSMRVQIRRKAGSHDILPVYSTAQLLQGVCHPIHIPLDEIRRATWREQQQVSREKFEEKKEEIYMALAKGRGVKFVANQYRIGYGALQRYLEEESK